MARMRPPKLHDKPVPVIRDSDLKALLDACAGKDVEARRDTAIVGLFMNTGARLSEIAGLTLVNVDLDHSEVAAAARSPLGRTIHSSPSSRTFSGLWVVVDLRP